jgi:hypothetical protein
MTAHAFVKSGAQVDRWQLLLQLCQLALLAGAGTLTVCLLFALPFVITEVWTKKISASGCFPYPRSFIHPLITP